MFIQSAMHHISHLGLRELTRWCDALALVPQQSSFSFADRLVSDPLVRLLNIVLALLIALSVVAAPLPAALGVAHAAMAHGDHDAATAIVERGCDHAGGDAPAHHANHAAMAHAAAETCADPSGAAGDLAQAGCCEMAMCHPFLFVRGVDAQRMPPVAIAAAWRIDTLVEDHRSNRIERPPRV